MVYDDFEFSSNHPGEIEFESDVATDAFHIRSSSSFDHYL